MRDAPTILIAIADAERAEEIAAGLEEDGFAVAFEGEAAGSAPLHLRDDGPGTPLRIASAKGESLGALPPDARVDLIASAVRLALAGYKFVAVAPASPPSAARDIHLTARERQVLSLLADGAPNKVIARALDISVHTAKFHVASLVEKLGARNRTDASVIALRDGHIHS